MAIDINEARVARNEFGMWLEWTLATAFGMLLGFLPTIILEGKVLISAIGPFGLKVSS